MFMAAARALAADTSKRLGSDSPLLPPLDESRRVARAIALSVAAAAQRDGHASARSDADMERLVDAKMWTPRYLPVRLKRG
jgi:malate dehydrogenase (oxaloacetate-decarboxylating)